MTQDMTRKMTINVAKAQRGNVLFPAWECFVSSVGINNSPKAHFLRSLLLLLVMMTFGTNVSWGQDLPFVVTTDADNSGEIEETEKHYYMIQSFINSAYYMRPNGTRVNTLNIITDDMKWYFLKAGDPESGVQYYYICDKDGRYMYFLKASGSMSDRTWMELKTDKTGIENNCKFTIEKNNTKGWNSYNIIPKGNASSYCLNKQGRDAGANGGTTKTGDIQVYDGYDEQSSNWFFIDVNDYEWTLHPECFTVSTDETTHYYKIQNKNFTAYYIMPGETYVKTSNSTSEDMVWYFKEAGSSDYMTYYYIIHAATGRYLRYRGNTGANTSSTELAEHTGSETGEAENRFRFIVSRGANANEEISDLKGITFNIVPLLLENAYTNNQYKYYCLSSTKTAGSNLAIEDKRSDNTAHWNFESTTYSGAWADPEISCDATGTTVTVTITCSDANTDIYYTTNGDTPIATETDTETNKKYTTPFTVNPGKTTIKARVIKTGKNPSNVVTKTIVLNPTITLSAASYTYTGSAQNPVSSVDYVDAENPENNIHFTETTQYTVSYKKENDAVPECKNAGIYTIVLNDADGDEYFIYGTGSFTIDKKPLTVTAKPWAITYGEAPANDGVTYSGFVEGETESVLSGELTYAYSYSQFGDVGDTYTITPDGLSSSNYEITFVAGTLTVDQKEVGLTWTNYDDLVYDGSAQKPTCGLTGVVNDDAVSAIVAGEQTNAGTGYTATASLTGEKAGNYKLPTLATHTFDIAKKTVTVTSGITAENKVYDGTTTATFDCSSAVVTGLLEGDNLTVTAATGTFDNKNVGENKTVTITGFTMGGTSGDNYKAADTGNQTSSTANITQLEAVLAWSNDALTYDATAQVPTATVSNAVEGDNVTVTVTGAETNVGESYTATATALSDANYKLPTEGLTHTFTIIAAALTVTADAQTKVYGDDDPTLTYTATGFQGSETTDIMKGALARTEGNNVGEYDITKGTLVAPNYTITFTSAKFTITPATLTVTADSQSKLYGALDPEFTYTVEGLKYEDTKEAVFEGTLTRAAGEEVGIYAITQGSLTAGNNYTISFTGANLIISKAKLTITAKPKTITYGDDPANDGVTYSGLADTDDESVLSGSLTYAYNTVANGTGAAYTKTSEPGSYYIIPSGLSAANYVITFAPGTLTVDPKEVVLNWGTTTSFTYDGEEHAPTVTATGTVNDEEIGVTVTGAQTNAQTNVEEEDYYKATASALTGDKAGNYKLPATNTQSFTITPKSLVDGTTLADGYTLDFGTGNTVLLKDDVIGSELEIDTDYSVSEDSDDSPKYSLRTVTGKGNYTGSFSVRNAIVSFTTDADQEEWSATFVAESSGATDIGHALPEGISAYIISGIQGEWAIPEPLEYIPAGVPVLLVAHKQTNGFVVTNAESGDVTQDQKDKNMLEVKDEAWENIPGATIYLLYHNEFVHNLRGTLPAGKVYLNPNHTSGGGSGAPAHLQIAWDQTTGIKDEKWKMEEVRSDYWYTLDGRRLSDKPTKKGLYINNGNKVVIK